MPSPNQLQGMEAAVEAAQTAQSMVIPLRPAGRSYVEAGLHAALPHLRASIYEELEIPVLCGELRRIAEEARVPNPSDHGLAVDVLTWAEGWLLQLSTAFNTATSTEGGMDGGE